MIEDNLPPEARWESLHNEKDGEDGEHEGQKENVENSEKMKAT